MKGKHLKYQFAIALLNLLFVLYCTVVCAQSPIDSAKKSLRKQTAFDEKISTYFFIADEFMNIDQYDSSQVWLNVLNEALPAKVNSLNNYLLTTRQAEVYYYNNLPQLGLEESRRGLDMAKALNDSFLLADSYNFLGLFLMNMDSVNAAVLAFKDGIKFLGYLPYTEKYISLTRPHHLYGNLAEAYYKAQLYDSAVICYLISKQKAKEINLLRGVAVADFGIAEVLAATNKLDSASLFYKNAIEIAFKSTDLDVLLIAKGGLAKAYQLKADKALADAELQNGIDLLKANPNINKFYALIFLKEAYAIYKQQNNTLATVEVLEQKSIIETKNVNGANAQMQNIVKAGLAKEKRILGLQVQEAEQKQQLANSRLFLTLAGIGLLAIIFFVYRYFQQQKQKVFKIRQNISQDLHDEIGASLSSLQIYSTLAENSLNDNPDKTSEMLQKISVQSKQAMENMNDIVWSMNTNEANAISLEAKIKNYSVELLSNNNIEFDCKVEAIVEQSLQNITAKRNILLIVREALNNISKYSKATTAQLNAHLYNKSLEISINDNGVGFNFESRKTGHGIGNMQKRAKELGGILDFDTKEKGGTCIKLIVPLKSL
jgi:signal transduction histidine kinase